MKPRLVSTVLGFFSEAAIAESRYQEIRSERRGRVRLHVSPNGHARSKQDRYRDLRLNGESLITVEVERSDVGGVVHKLRKSGSPAVFTTQEFGQVQPQPAGEQEPLAAERLREFTIELARKHGPPGPPRPGESLLAGLAASEKAIEEARNHLIEAARLGHSVTAAAQWLLDNYYLARTHAAQVRRHLPKDYGRVLPTLPSRNGNLRIAELAREIVRHTDHALNEAAIIDCAAAYQIVEPLTIAELWAYPLLLEVALLEGLAVLAAHISEAQQVREAAYLWANRLAASARQEPEAFERILHLMEAEPVSLLPYFSACLTEQLQGDENAFVPVQHWLEEHLRSPLGQLIEREHLRETRERVSISNVFQSLRGLAQIDFADVFEKVSLVESRLREDPTGIYPQSSFSTRDQCRKAVENLSRSSGRAELDVASTAMRLSTRGPEVTSVAWYLLGEGSALLEAELRAVLPWRRRFVRSVRRHAVPVYLGSIGLLTASFLVIAVTLAWSAHETLWAVAGFAALAAFILSELAVQVVNALIISLLPPEKLPQMDDRVGIREQDATLVVVPMMLSSAETVRREIEKLEVRYLANQDDHLFFSLFPDFMDSDEPTASADADLLRIAQEGIDGLNSRYPGGRFLLFHRQRVWSESEQRWIGWERKRGKLEELNAFLCGSGHSEILNRGRLPLPIRYVITLDADTQLPPGTARRLIATIAHPLNRVAIDPETSMRRSGYSIIQPRVSVTLPSANASRFTRIFADASGTDPYCEVVSDAQQDLFREAMFHGKAIYDVRAFHQILGGRFPPETLLSHDLIEGAHVGVGLASDIELLESIPESYAAYSQRQRRWIRGDWQIARWVLPRVPAAEGGTVHNPLSAVNRWRIFDNLRRSLVPAATLLLLLLAWLVSAAPGVWTLVIAVAFAMPALAPLLDRLARRVEGTARGWKGAPAELARVLVSIVLLPHQAWLAVDAVVRVIHRQWISHRNLLQWQTAEWTQKSGQHMESTVHQLLLLAGLSVVLIVAVMLRGVHITICVFAVCWVLAPGLLLWLDQAAAAIDRPRISSEDDVIYLRRFARRTWRYFDDLVNESSNWLPPDNKQLALRVEVAERTSPTNIGLWLVSALSAFDLGYLTVEEFAKRCSLTMDTLDKLEHYEGHILNWYNTTTLEPLLPRYVSTVDSGNLLASLWVLEQGCKDAMDAPLAGPACLRGLADALTSLDAASGNDSSAAAPLRELRRFFRADVQGAELIGRLRLAMLPARQLADQQDWLASPGDERSYWAGCLHREIQAWMAITSGYLSWMEVLTQPPDSFLRVLGEGAVKQRRRAAENLPSLRSVAEGTVAPVNALLGMRRVSGMPPRVTAWLDQVAEEYERSKAAAALLVEKLRTLAAKAAALSTGMNMRFLFNPRTRLFTIGYAVGGPVDFNSHYDLLASEARLAGLVAIAKGDAPVAHWFMLGRPRSASPVGDILLSWNGAMFEYLMPVLFTRTYANSLLDEACRRAVQMQIRYGHERGVPWGISESAYAALDATQIYQYRGFGVPGLGLKPGLEDDLVVAPYATMLALMVDPDAAVTNLRRLEELKMGGPLGLYEAIDFSRESSPEGNKGVVVYNDMAHHHGMSLIAMNNVLTGDIMQRRFHADLRIRAVESLLFERVPLTLPLSEIGDSPQLRPQTLDESEPAGMDWTAESAVPIVNLLGNGHYSLMVTNSGGGYLRYDNFDVTRWRPDTTLDRWGSFIYVRDTRSGRTWSTTYHPMGGRASKYSAHFAPDRAQIHCHVLGINTQTEVTVAVEDRAELRRVTVTNRLLRTRQIELTSFAELALAPHNADRAHPAFSKMFVETECFEGRVLIARRRPRSPEDPQIWAAHLIVGHSGPFEFETDRRTFIGRGNTAASPDALRRNLTGSTGAVLDPIFSLRCRLDLDPRERQRLTFVTLAAPTREELLALIAKYERPESVARAFEMAWTRAQLEFRYLGIGPSAAQRYQELAGHMLYPHSRMRPPADRLARNRLGQSQLWGYGISGDRPIATVSIAEARDLPLVRELLLAHNYWHMRGFRADLVILNQETPQYDQPLRQQVERMIRAHALQSGPGPSGGVFLLDWNSMPEVDRTLVLAASGVVLYGGRGSLRHQLVSAPDIAQPPELVVSQEPRTYNSQPLPFLELDYFNGTGGFSHDQREYAIYLAPGLRTPAPWSNVLANSGFGTLITESGLGFTWCGNSQANRLTPWHNDPVCDPQSEIIYLRDEETGAVWTPTALPIREGEAYRARHSQAYTAFEYNGHAIGQDLTVFVPGSADGSGDPVKICRLRLRNDSGVHRTLSVTYYAEWVLGTDRESNQMHVQTSWDDAAGALLARNPWNVPYTSNIAFLAASTRPASYTGDRSQFLGRNGSMERPAALGRMRLNNRTGAGLDPAGAVQVSVTLEPHAQTEVTFLLGEAASLEQVRELVNRYRAPQEVEAALARTRQTWDERLGALTVRTPVLSVDLMLNRWLLHQSLSCRMFGRSGFYQSGGAFGFRDQLQDSMALVYAMPGLTRGHILTSAARQFREGDVQHWWHADTGAGVRTRCSDDLVWLPYVVARYVEATGDAAILEEEVPFLEGETLPGNEQEKLFTPAISVERARLWEHCRRALDRAWQLGPHALPLIGNGDWNDGLNRVGPAGMGESVWLAWFLHTTYTAFAALAESRDQDMTRQLRERAAELAQAVEETCWDGEWYLRGFFDDGSPLGSNANPEAKIDSLPQSWAAISGAGNPKRTTQGIESCNRMLVRPNERLVLLFTPPFDHSKPNPGYIMGYPPGVRENGGQYTHGSLWLAMAQARRRQGHAAAALLQLMNPVEGSRNPQEVERYQTEPYVVAADVASAPDRIGRGGWTWYTGSAAWMYRIWVEEVLGIHRRGDSLTIDPVIPGDWPGYSVTFRHRLAVYEIQVERDAAAKVLTAEVDGRHVEGATLQMSGEGRHKVVVRMPPQDWRQTAQ